MKNNSFLSCYSQWCEKLALPAIILFLVSLVLRMAALGRYVTPDELIWVYRSVLFREALLGGSWADTLVAGHPGVTTTWLGAIGISFQLLLRSVDQDIYHWITQLAWLTPDNTIAFQKLNHFLTAGRILVTLVNSMGIVAVFILARRLLSACPAFFLAALLAVDPFFAGLSGLLHVDGLASTFVTLSLLSLALALGLSWKDEKGSMHLKYSAVSGGTAALAVLSKSPSLLLVPLAGLMFLLFLWQNRTDNLFIHLKKSFFLSIIWLGSFFLLIILLYPAIWTSAGEVLQLAGGNATRHVEEALRPTFFLGQMAFDHGWLFYPIAIAWRIGPVVTVGLIFLILLILRREGRKNGPLRLVLIFGLWTILFIILIGVTAKKFDRYALPVFPALTFLAVIGWGYWLGKANRRGWYFLLSLLAVQLVYTIFVWPFPLSTYNPLLGGSNTAYYVLPLGWGESVSLSGQWLAGEVEAGKKSAVSGIAPSLAPFFPGETLYAEDEEVFDQADYIIFTVNSRQIDPQGVENATADLDLLQIIRYSGLDQSWIYTNPNPVREDLQPVDLQQPISFDGKIALSGQDLQTSNGEVQFTARWESQVSDHGTYLVKLKLKDENNHTWAELETALLNEVYFYPENWNPGETPIIAYELDLPPTTPPGEYTVELSLIDKETTAQLPVIDVGTFSGVVYEAGSVKWGEPGASSTDGLPSFTQVAGADWLDGSLRMLGYAVNPARVVAGAGLTLDIFWQAIEALPPGMRIALQLGSEEPVLLPLSRFDSGDWQPGRIIQEKYRLPVPAGMISGSSPLTIWPLLAEGQALDGRVEFAVVDIVAADRLFSLPDDIPIPLGTRFEPGIYLRGAGPAEASANVGGTLPLTLYWQTETQMEQPVTAFLHLVDENGEIVAQIDRWPGGLPSNIWSEGQVIIDEYELSIPLNIRPGEYEIVVGLYDTQDGRRLPAINDQGQRLLDDRVILPILVEIRP